MLESLFGGAGVEEEDGNAASGCAEGQMLMIKRRIGVFTVPE